VSTKHCPPFALGEPMMCMTRGAGRKYFQISRRISGGSSGNFLKVSGLDSCDREGLSPRSVISSASLRRKMQLWQRRSWQRDGKECEDRKAQKRMQ
jgi:hypothetical protein